MRTITLFLLSLPLTCLLADRLSINDQGYFEKPGLNVTVFSDIHPDGHQTGVSVIQHGVRVAANIEKTGWAIGRVMPHIDNEPFKKTIAATVESHQNRPTDAIGEITPDYILNLR